MLRTSAVPLNAANEVNHGLRQDENFKRTLATIID